MKPSHEGIYWIQLYGDGRPCDESSGEPSGEWVVAQYIQDRGPMKKNEAGQYEAGELLDTGGEWLEIGIEFEMSRDDGVAVIGPEILPPKAETNSTAQSAEENPMTTTDA